MKKLAYTILLSFSLVLTSACGILPKSPIDESIQPTKSGTTETEVTPKPQTGQPASAYSIKDYFPFKENTFYEFEGTGNEYAAFTVWVDYVKGDKIQLRKNNGGTEVASVIQNSNGELKIVFSKEEAYYREDFTTKPANRDEILLKEPLVKGTSWTLPDGRKRYISNIDVDITTPSGSYKALEVTTEGKDAKVLDYYALNTGHIQSLFTASGMEVKSALKKITSNTSLTQNVRFYYPNINDNKLYYLDKQLSFKTNDITKMSFEKVFKEAPDSNLGKLIGPNVKIKSLYLNNDVVYVDFSKELISEMNAGSGYESMILQSITNTLGGYYGVQKVYILVENEPYSSGHILMKKGETFTVNTKGTVQLKNK
jgi:hypothetical protein